MTDDDAPDTLPTGKVPDHEWGAGPAIDATVRARHFTAGRLVPVNLLVVHTTESPCAAGVARAVAGYFASPGAPQASAHYVIGPDVTIECVCPHDTAWHAPGANARAIGIEHAARARFAEAEWLDADPLAMLRRSASLVAWLCARYGIPIERPTVAQLAAGAAGIVGHGDVSKAFHKGDHWDPGPHFPWAAYLELVREASR